MNRMMFLLGLLFGFGLLLSGMSNPQKVQDFLDVLGRWDASLAFVMGGAVLVTFIAFRGGAAGKPRQRGRSRGQPVSDQRCNPSACGADHRIAENRRSGADFSPD